MGKKRRFKRDEEKKGSGSRQGKNFPMKEGIIVPGANSFSWDDSRPNPHKDMPEQTPPHMMTEEELAQQKALQQHGETSVSDSDDDNAHGKDVSDDAAKKQDDMNAQIPRFQRRKSVAEVLAEQSGDDALEREQSRRTLLASAWRARDGIYQQLFGKPSYVTPANYGPPSEEVPADFLEKERTQRTSYDTSDPGDPTLEEQHLAVLAYGPDPLSPCWKYVTAGLSSPWLQEEPQPVSGFGFELMVKSPVDAPWAAQFLRTLAFYVFNHAGLLSVGSRVKLNSSIDPGMHSELRNSFIWYADDAPDTLYDLPSGGFGIFIAIGMTDDELKYAESIEEYGTWCVQAVLRQAGYGQITDPKRECAMKNENIHSIISSVNNFAETFRANRAGHFTEGDTTVV